MATISTSEKLEVFDDPVFDYSLVSLNEHTYKPYGSPTYSNSDEIRIPIHFQDLILDIATIYIYRVMIMKRITLLYRKPPI